MLVLLSNGERMPNRGSAAIARVTSTPSGCSRSLLPSACSVSADVRPVLCDSTLVRVPSGALMTRDDIVRPNSVVVATV